MNKLFLAPVRRHTLVALICVSGLHTAANAADEDTAAADQAGVGTLEEITVTARKRAESVLDVPDSVTAFSRQNVEAAGIETMRDFTNLTPNIVFTSNGPGYPVLLVRGISQAQGGEPPVAVVIDGVQVAHPAFIAQDYGDLERVEVLRGPQGSLYGRNAIGGAINIVTRQPSNELEGSVKASYGNADTVRSSANVSGPIVQDRALFRIGVDYNRTDGQIRNLALGTMADQAEDVFARGLLLVEFTDALSLDVRLNYAHNDDGNATSEIVSRAQFDQFTPGFLTRNVDAVETRTVRGASAKLEYEAQVFTITSVTDYSTVDDRLRGDADFSAAPVVLQDVQVAVDALTQELRLTSSSDAGLRWLFGAFYQDRDTDNFLRVPLDDGSGRPSTIIVQQSLESGSSESSALFGSASIDLTSQLELTLGARYDRDRRESADIRIAESQTKRTFSAFQPKVQLAYKLRPSLNTYVTYGRGFRSGGFNAFVSTAVDRVYEDETADNFEIGIKGALAGGTVRFAAAAFRTYYDNQQFFFVALDPPTQNTLNIDRTRIDGAELEVNLQATDSLELAAGVGITDAKIDKFAAQPQTVGNDSPKNIPYTVNLEARHVATLTAGLDLRTFLSYRRQGEKYWDAANSLRTPPKDFVNARLFLEGGKWRAGVFGTNLLNEQYPTDAVADVAGVDRNVRLPSFRRAYGVEVAYDF